MLDLGDYDVAVVGAGVTGIVSAVAAAEAGANTCLIEASGILGGLITGGRLTKPTGVIQPGVYLDLVNAAAGYGGADPSIRVTDWGSYSGIFDTEVMQRVVIEAIDRAGVDVLLYAQAVDTVKEGRTIAGVAVQTKSGVGIVRARNFVDASGDGDLAAVAGADFMLGRPSDGRMQPMTSYFRIINVDLDALTQDAIAHADDMYDLVTPDPNAPEGTSGMNDFFCRGYVERIQQARSEGFDWILPKRHITLKTGMLPGEINVNATRVHGNALDPRERSHATLEVRRQAYCVHDFLKRYVGGFENSVLLEISPVLGVRETRRVVGDYVLTEADVRSEQRFDDAIGLCTDPIDIHDPAGEGGNMESVGRGYGIPYRSLLVAGLDNLLVAGRCLSVDPVAHGSTRNTPACALTGQAAGIAAAMASADGTGARGVSLSAVQQRLTELGVVLGREDTELASYMQGSYAQS
jgi:hypothetical protein